MLFVTMWNCLQKVLLLKIAKISTGAKNAGSGA